LFSKGPVEKYPDLIEAGGHNALPLFHELQKGYVVLIERMRLPG
jgi:hypothetical protein